MNTKHKDQQISDRFVYPSSRPRRFGSMPPAGAALAFLLLALAIVAFQFTEESSWYAVAGGLSLIGSIVLGWRYRAVLPSAFRHPHDDDPRKLYNSRNAS